MAKLTAKEIGEYFLAKCNSDFGDTISNLKLQKLVYYAQGFHLAMYNAPLFSEQIKAWQHGPVIPTLYSEYKGFGDGAIPVPRISLSKYSRKVQLLLNDIWKVYGQFSAWKLRNMTHEEPPWQSTTINGVITHSTLKNYFKNLLIRD